MLGAHFCASAAICTSCSLGTVAVEAEGGSEEDDGSRSAEDSDRKLGILLASMTEAFHLVLEEWEK